MGVNGIYGLSGSGLDVESLVKVGMLAKQSEYDKMAQKYTKNEWTKAEYLELNSTINTFNNSTLHQYKLQNNMNAKEAESTSSAIKVSASASAAVMNHTVDVKGLSANAYLISTNKMTRYAITSDTANSSSTNLADVLFSDLTLDTRGDGKTYARGHVATSSADATSYTFGKTSPKVLMNGDSDYNDANAYWQKSDGNGGWTNLDFDPSVAPGTEPTLRSEPAEPQKSDYYGWNSYTNTWSWPSQESQYNADYAAWQTDHNTWLTEKAQYDTDHAIWQTRTDYATNSNNFRKVIDKDASTLDMNQTAFSFTISDGKNSGSISYSYGDLLGDNKKTLTDLASDIKNLGLNITASYDVTRDQFTIFNKESGLANTVEITIGADTGNSTATRDALTTRNFFTNLGLYQSVNGELQGDNGATATMGDGNSLKFNLSSTKTVTGDDNEVVIDGITYKEASNKITVGGVTYTALNKTNGPTTVTISQDTDAIIDKVKSFVNDYNKLLSSLYEKYDEKSDSNYKPLTQSQKDSMKEEQITKWEEKAKKGLLYHDQTLGRIIQDMRSAITESVQLDDGSKVSIFSLGISTTGLKGQLELDEDKLKKALEKDPDIVSNVFTHLDKDNNYTRETNGVAQRLGDVFTTATKRIKSRAGSSADITEDSDLNNLMRSLQTRMSNFKKMMNAFETALYKKYDAMEATLAKLGTQLNFVMGGNS